MRVVSLGSGSSGNALLVEVGATRVVVDAGFPARVLGMRLRQVGVAPGTLAAILLTHEHHDHACGARALAWQHRVPLVADARTLRAVPELPQGGEVVGKPACEELPVGSSRQFGELEVRSFAVSHDAAAPCGYLLSAGAWSACLVTDTGEVGQGMLDALRTARLIVLEANHDRERLLAGPYPWPLKRRILSSTGHLSNAQAAEALAEALDGASRWVWLAHLSKTNNTPELAHATVRRHLGLARLRGVELRVAPPDLGLTWESPRAAEQGMGQPTLWGDAAAAPAPRGSAGDALPTTRQAVEAGSSRARRKGGGG
jgi:phosphoribosyl 1,2-cyclic phosphodiesterase